MYYGFLCWRFLGMPSNSNATSLPNRISMQKRIFLVKISNTEVTEVAARRKSSRLNHISSNWAKSEYIAKLENGTLF